MYLPALTLGYAVPTGNFDTAVHSVFHSALNLRPMDEEHLLTLVKSSEPDLPQGIRIDTPDGFSFEGIHIGDSVTGRDGILRFEKSYLTVRLTGAQRWDSALSKLEVDTTKPAVLAAWNFVWNALNRRQKSLNAEIVGDDLFCRDGSSLLGVSRKVSKAMRELVDATQRCDEAGFYTIQALIGLGSGLTPSGDDLLAGFIAGLWCTTQNESGRTQFISALGKSIIAHSTRTNDISRTYLYHAAYGHVSSRLIALVKTISNGEISKRLLDTAESAMQTGSTSGMDAVTGLLIGISAWNKEILLFT
jgi:hypothetical protein